MSDPPTRERLRLVIADDHPVVLEGLRSALCMFHEIVGTVSRLADLEAAVDRLDPDVLITDLSFRGEGSALPLLTAARERGTLRCPYLVVTVHQSESHINELYRAGAAGYLPKGARIEEIRAAVRAAMRGERTFPDEVMGLAPSARAPGRYQHSRVVEIDDVELTEREIAIMLEVHRGVSRNEIARKFGIKPRTVEYHLDEARRRIGFRKASMLLLWINEQIDALRQAVSEE